MFESLPSTNSWLLEQAIAVGQASLCVAETQTQGRGRRGNRWHAAAGQNITFSLGWCFPAWPQGVSGLSLAVGMVVAEELNSAHSLNVKVKWPNDLMVDDKKLGGVLIELAGETNGPCQVVIGLGLNVSQPHQSDHSADYQWQDLRGLGLSVDRNELVGQLSRALVQMLQAFEQHGFQRLVAAWPEISSYADRTIRVTDGEAEVVGMMTGVDEVGALLVTDQQGQAHRFADSRVSVRLVN